MPVGFDFPAGSKDWCAWAGNTKFAYGITKYVKLAIFPAVFIQDVFVKPSVSKDSLEMFGLGAQRLDPGPNVDLEGRALVVERRRWKYPAVPAKTFLVPAGKGKEIRVGPFPWGLGPESYWWPNIPFQEDYVARLHNLKLELTEGAVVLARNDPAVRFLRACGRAVLLHGQRRARDQHQRRNGRVADERV